MKDRIIQIMRSAGLSNAEFADKIGISTSSLSHIFSGRNNPSLDMVKRLHKSFPDISLNWILYGEGDMYAGGASSTEDYENGTEGKSDENLQNTDNGQFYFDFRKEKPSEEPVYTPQIPEKEQIKYIEKPAPKITEIRIFYDNGTFEVFKPENK
ncbi:helix-turn-helix transcriptional regulator [Bacteroides caecigallinarum]|uniref:helix-turn-helix domain-containing protein n=1 Tax=Bacteroides caecigallinarum TaxID=1411144 RepID=UPI001F47119C|nr:helix-turn-helix transcriptional regulator [Bacteroides caecigallinarum]MCF2593455.1 helix-turn-helix transcriptional regulator [Bacteroides caecigallinarum]